MEVGNYNTVKKHLFSSLRTFSVLVDSLSELSVVRLSIYGWPCIQIGMYVLTVKYRNFYKMYIAV